MNCADHRRRVHVEAIFRRSVSDLISEVPNDLGDIEQRICCDLAADEQQPHCHVRIARTQTIMSQTFVKNGVGDLVTELVDVPFRHGFGRLRG